MNPAEDVQVEIIIYNTKQNMMRQRIRFEFSLSKLNGLYRLSRDSISGE